MTKKELIISFNEILKRKIISSKDKAGSNELSPQQIKAETSILGALLLEGEDSKLILNFLIGRARFSEIRRYIIFSHISSLFNFSSSPINISTVNALLEEHGLLNDVGVDYVEELRNNALSKRQIKFLTREIDNLIIYYHS